MTNTEIANKFISDLHNAEHNGGVLYIPDCIIGWKELGDGSYIVIFDEESPMLKLKEAWNEFIDAIAKEWYLYEILDWLSARVGK